MALSFSQIDLVLTSIIICTTQRCTQLAATLDSLARVTIPPGLKVELVVIENGPKDGTETELRRCATGSFALRYIHESQKGKSRALNRGLAETRGDVLLFADDDLRFPETWLTGLCRPILENRTAAVTGGVRIPDHLKRSWMTPYHLGWLGCIRYADPEHPDEMAGANMAFHRQVLDKVPRFDEELGGGGLGNCEDTLFSRQVREAGFPLHAAPDAQVEHHFDASKLLYPQWVRNAHAAGRSRAYLLHHWHHSDLPNPRLRSWLLSAKLHARRRMNQRFLDSEEGIHPWELSYRFDLAMLAQFQIERRRPRNYALRGLTKIRS